MDNQDDSPMQKTDEFRVKRIQQMLLEMAKGNFFYSLEPMDRNDNITALVVMLNMVSEEIRASFIHQGFANAHHTPQCIIQLSLLMDHNGTIEMATNSACSLLSRLPKDIIGRPLTELLTGTSQQKWRKKLPKLLQRDRAESTLKLEFTTPEGLLLPKNCSVSVFRDLDGQHQKILLDTVCFTKGEPFGKGLKKNRLMVAKGTRHHKVHLGPRDIQIIRNVHDLILNNLEKDLPTLKDLARQEGTNEYKLKYGFKQIYGTTIFRFLIRERLRMARTLIQHSGHSLKHIAHMTGFKSITHFSRVFKDKYGLPPSELRS